MKVQVLFLALCVAAASAIPLPMKLLKVPKIYNALITTNQKLLPSEAFPASTGLVFEPIGLSGDPVLLNPEAFLKEDPVSSEGEKEVQDEAEAPMSDDIAPRPFAKAGKKPAPVVFYPRYNVYHQLPQALYPYGEVYQPPPVVVPVQRSEPPKLSSSSQPNASEGTPSDVAPQTSSRPQGFGFVANNRPSNADIPHVPPPPPPVSATRQASNSGDSDS